MIEERVHPNGEVGTDLVAALISKVGAIHNEALRLSGDLRRLHRKIDATHRNVDRLHRKIERTHARIRILRSQGRVQRRKAPRAVSTNRYQAVVKSD